MEFECETNSALETKKIGELLGKELIGEKLGNKAKILALEGGLGGGKTTFLQGFSVGLGIKDRVLSPTFVIVKKFRIKKSEFNFFYHIDCYRIQKQKEIVDLDFKTIISNPSNIVAIEWSERIKRLLPKDIILIVFEFINENKRKITING